MSWLRPLMLDDRGARVVAVIAQRALRRAALFLALPVLLLLPFILYTQDARAGCFLVLFIPGVWNTINIMRHDPADRRMINIERRHCPACEYNLEGISMEPDGCTVCPECGAAWKLEGTAEK